MRGPRGKSPWESKQICDRLLASSSSCDTTVAPEINEPRGWVDPLARDGDPAAVGVGTEAGHPLRYTPRRATVASSP